jgi:hypothetical protein
MVLGVYYLTMKHQAAHPGDGRAFADIDEVTLCRAGTQDASEIRRYAYLD